MLLRAQLLLQLGQLEVRAACCRIAATHVPLVTERLGSKAEAATSHPPSAAAVVYDASDDACLNSGGVLEQAANQAAEACEEAHPALEEDVARVYNGIETATDERRKELEERAVGSARRQVDMSSALPENFRPAYACHDGHCHGPQPVVVAVHKCACGMDCAAAFQGSVGATCHPTRITST